MIGKKGKPAITIITRMKIYTVRKAITNATTATNKGEALSIWTSWNGASAEVTRLFTEKGIECYITTETENSYRGKA